MKLGGWLCASLFFVGFGAAAADVETHEHRLVFGSFASEENAVRYARHLTQLFGFNVQLSVTPDNAVGGSDPAAPSPALAARAFRVVGPVAGEATLAEQSAIALQHGVESWRLSVVPDKTRVEPAAPEAPAPEAPADEAYVDATAAVVARSPSEVPFDEQAYSLDLDLGLQGRLFAHRGSNTPDRAQQSVSASLQWSRELSGGQQLLAFEAFGRLDSDDSRRTHADIREASITHVADRWQLQAGIGQVFWGVVEFNHLIDVVNQTDLIENLDGEDKLGAPMVAFTALPDWGSVELYVLPRFRERTLPSLSGRLTFALPFDRSETRYESGAGKERLDALVRISSQVRGVAFDVYHFNGTRRTPRFELGTRAAEPVLIPAYDTVKQTALAVQSNWGDTAFKLEALQQDGGPESYWAAAGGLEHTFVGVFGGASDLGAVIEYHYDSRGGRAFDSFFESDLALGLRLGANDIHDSQALFGVVWDTSRDERVIILEANRRLNDRWSLALESRWFSGGKALSRSATVADLFDTDNKLGAVQRDDYFQFEFTRFF